MRKLRTPLAGLSRRMPSSIEKSKSVLRSVQEVVGGGRCVCSGAKDGFDVASLDEAHRFVAVLSPKAFDLVSVGPLCAVG